MSRPAKRPGFQVWILLLLFGTGAFAQWPSVETFSIDEGLPSQEIRDLASHPDGRLWILTRLGSVVYDGQTFQAASFPGIYLRRMTIDERGTVWTAYGRQISPVFYLDGNRWQRLPRISADGTLDLTSFLVTQGDGRSTVALGTLNGLWLFKDRQWIHLGAEDGLPSDRVYGLALQARNIAVATAGGLCILERETPGCAASTEDTRLQEPILALQAEKGPPSRLWLLSSQYLGFLKQGKVTVVREGVTLSPDLPGHLLVDTEGGVYFGNRSDLYYLEPAGPSKPYLRKPHETLRRLGVAEGLISEGTTALGLDRESNVWIGSEQGLSRMGSRRFFSWRKAQGLLGDGVTAITETGPGRFVLGHWGGLSFLEEGEVRTLSFAGDPQDSRVFDLEVDQRGTVWVAASMKGLWSLEPDGRLREHALGIDDGVRSVEIDREDRLWVATRRRVYVREGAGFRARALPQPLFMEWLTAGEDGRMYVSTEDQGLAIFDGEAWTRARGPTVEANHTFGVLPEASGRVWVGTMAGLHELRGDRLVPVSFWETSRPVFMIFRDLKARLWIGTDDGMYVWDGDRLRHLSVRHGLAGRETNRGAGMVDSQGYVWIGTERGLSVYDERYDREPRATPIAELVGFEVNGEEHPLADLQLSYDQNNLTWRFGTIAFSREASVVTRYRLEGFEKIWHKGLQVREARYTNLPAGTYRLHVAAGWEGGAWGEEVSTKVVVVRPLWRRPWFLMLLAAAITGMVFVVNGFRLRALRRRNAELVAFAKRLMRSVAVKDRIFVQILRAESPAHLAALRDELRTMEPSGEHEDVFLHAEFFSDLRRMIEGLESLDRLPSSEDRAYVLGQALTRALSLQERLENAENGKLGLGGMALKTVEEIFSTALLDVQQHAELELELRSRRLTAHREATVVLEVRNTGRGDARDIEVELDADEAALNVTRPRQLLPSLRRGQSAQLEFLVEPHHSERVRLSFRVTWDDFLAPGDDPGRRHERRFADVVELRRFQEPAVFRPLRPNPYVVGRPLLDTDLFYGREQLFGRLATSLEGAAQDNVVILIGQRRMGKTSILRRLHRHLPKIYVPVLVDLQGLLGEGEPAFFREVTGQVVDELEERGVQVAEPEPSDFETDPGIFFRRRFLPRVRGALQGRRLLLVFDEFEVLEERIQSGALTPQVLPYLRSLMQHEKGVSFLLAGTHRLDDLTADYWGVLFNLAVYLEVGHLTEHDVEALLAEPTSGSFEIDFLAQEKVIGRRADTPTSASFWDASWSTMPTSIRSPT